MRQIGVQDIEPGIVKGINVQMPPTAVGYREAYFEWTPSSLTVPFKTNEVSGGILRAGHHVPVFCEVETHADAEMFYFLSGTALMLFVDVNEGQADLESAQIVRIPAGTQLVIPSGKGHFVPVAEGDESVEMIVVAPRMDAPRVPLPTPIEGV